MLRGRTLQPDDRRWRRRPEGRNCLRAPKRSKLATMRVLLVEDDPQLASIIESGLREHSFEVIREATAPAGRSRALLGAFDVIILDVMLPGGDGFSLCKALRDRGIGTP